MPPLPGPPGGGGFASAGRGSMARNLPLSRSECASGPRAARRLFGNILSDSSFLFVRRLAGDARRGTAASSRQDVHGFRAALGDRKGRQR